MGMPELEGLKYDDGKLRYDLVPVSAIEGDAEVFTYGAQKYGAYNWENGIDEGRLFAAAMRHIMAWKAGEKNDSESSIHHLKHARVNLAMLVEFDKATHNKDEGESEMPKDTISPEVSKRDDLMLRLETFFKLTASDDENDPRIFGTECPAFVMGENERLIKSACARMAELGILNIYAPDPRSLCLVYSYRKGYEKASLPRVEGSGLE